MRPDGLRDDTAALDVADQHDRDIRSFGEAHIGDIAFAEIDFGRAPRPFDEDEIGNISKPRERGEYRGQQIRRYSAIFSSRGGAPDLAVQYDLCSAFGLWLQ